MNVVVRPSVCHQTCVVHSKLVFVFMSSLNFHSSLQLMTTMCATRYYSKKDRVTDEQFTVAKLDFSAMLTFMCHAYISTVVI
jgi:hypothetical protein